MNDYSDEVGCYVRFQLISNEGGITFSQAFIVDDGTLSEQDGTVYTEPTYPQYIQPLVDTVKAIKHTRIAAVIQLLRKKF